MHNYSDYWYATVVLSSLQPTVSLFVDVTGAMLGRQSVDGIASTCQLFRPEFIAKV